MRTSLSRATIMMVVAASLAAFCVTGCQTTGASKTPSSSWFSWGKKKPASSTLGSNMTKPSSSLPAPPSSTASPNPVPSYAQNTQRAGFGAAPTGSGMGNSGPAANPTGYGTQGTGSSHYANASYNNNPAAPAGVESSAPYGRPAANPPAGSYSPSGYADNYGQPANAGGYGGASGSARTASGSAGSYPGAAGGTSNPNAPFGAGGGVASQNAYGGATVSSDRGQAWGANSPDAGTARSPAMPAYDPRTAPAGAYGQRGAQDPSGASSYPAGAASSYGQAPANYGSTNSGTYVPSGGAFGQDSASQGGSYADPAGARTDSSGGLSAGGYRPGSTGRATRFGDSQQINVGSADSVQSASYNTARDANSRAPVNDRNSPAGSQPAASDYDTGSAPSGRTATGGNSYPNPSSYQR
ncbi:MAG: hypothetical protein NTY19_38855 [Planctomycetota bacterium]|nr:hypothetical protein [Planctomycetota bacterium]